MRTVLEAAAEELKRYRGVIPDRALTYIVGGDEQILRQLRPQGFASLPREVVECLPAPEGLDEPALRVVRVLARMLEYYALANWLAPKMLDAAADGNLQSILVSAFEVAGMETADLVAAVVDRFPLERQDGSATSAGQWLQARHNAELYDGVLRTNILAGPGLDKLVDFLLRRRPESVDAVAPAIALHPSGRLQSAACARILKATGTRHAQPMLETWRATRRQSKRLPNAYDPSALTEQARIGIELAAACPETFGEPVRELVLSLLTDLAIDIEPTDMAKLVPSVLRAKKQEYLDALLVSLRDPDRGPWVAIAVGTVGGPECVPLLLAAFELSAAEARLKAAERLKELNLETDCVLRTVRHELRSGSPHVGFVNLASSWRTEDFAEDLWKVVANKSNPVREAAIRGLTHLGDACVPRALQLLTAKKNLERDAAVRVLAAANTAECRKALEERLDLETDDAVRDRILLALDAGEQAVSREVLQKRIERSLKRIASLPADWIRLEDLPRLKWRDGSSLDETAARYLLYRQSRVLEMRADIEARAVYSELDRAASGDFALALLRAYFATGQDADDRWVLALSALVGDDRLVPVMMKQIAFWTEKARGKLAEYAVQAMALLGTDVALSAVNSLSVRYATQFRNIGAAASAAFAAAAEAQGVDVDELGDRVVSSLGLPRTVSSGSKAFELRVDLEGKLVILDLESKRKVAALPKSASAELLTDCKDLKAALKEVWKGQVRRVENLMVQQLRWPVARWRDLYPRHPILLPFAARLVWGSYDVNQRLCGTFRAREDSGFTTAADEDFELPEVGFIGIVHPVDLTEEVRESWKRHLADYELAPPFPQLDRPVVRVAESQRQEKEFLDVDGTELNAMTFRGRAEKLGWRRGSVCDAGGIPFYCKSFAAAGADVFVGIDNMYIGIDMYSSIILRKAFFVRSGSVKIGSYVYDEPEKMTDPRVLAFGEVGPIAFSETIGDLRRIAGIGKPDAPEQES